MAEVAESLHRAAVCHEVIDNQHMVQRSEEALRDDDRGDVLVGEGFDLGREHLAVDVDGLRLLREQYRHAEDAAGGCGDSDAGGLDGQDLGDGDIGKVMLPLKCHRVQKLHIDLVVQERIDLEDIAFLDGSILEDALFQKLHA